MTSSTSPTPANKIASLDDLAKWVSYSFVDTLNSDPDGKTNGVDHWPRQVFSGHYVPVKPTPIDHPEYVAHSFSLFDELGFADNLAKSADFIQMFSGDLSQVPQPMHKVGWATGYALSIYGSEYLQQCPFRTGNGYGDGRAISILELVINQQRYEMQLKGGGQTPYCRGADGRAVLRSSVREFLAQEHMHALGVATSRSLSLYVSKSASVQRPWYSEGSLSRDPDRTISESVAISTRVAPSFIRVGQLELFARRARKNEHPKALQELQQIVQHAIFREYPDEIDVRLPIAEQVVLLASAFRDRLTSLIANWLRVGFCQGNFNSDNCAVGGFTLDYGPFGFCDLFNPNYQSWTGGGQHFSFFNQPLAAQQNFYSFCTALAPLLASKPDYLQQLELIQRGFSEVMQNKMEKMWAAKLGLCTFDADLFAELQRLMIQTSVDYTIFFRELSSVPDDITPLQKSFYQNSELGSSSTQPCNVDSEKILKQWSQWLGKWHILINQDNTTLHRSADELSRKMKGLNPKYILREWFLVPAYQQANAGDYSLLQELQKVMTQPYAEGTKEIQDKYYRLKPAELFDVGGLSHLSCSS